MLDYICVGVTTVFNETVEILKRSYKNMLNDNPKNRKYKVYRSVFG